MAIDKGSFGDIQWPPLLFSIIGFLSYVIILILLFIWSALRYCLSCCCPPTWQRSTAGGYCPPEPTAENKGGAEEKQKKKKLVVILHGYTSTEGSLAQLETAICTSDKYKEHVDVLIPGRPGLIDSFRNTKWFSFMGLFSTNSPDEVVEMIRSQIAAKWNFKKHESVVLVGHSITQEASNSTWVNHVDRLVLLSATNRGFTVTRPLFFYQPFFLLLFGVLEVFRFRFFISHFRRGSVFISQLRLEWLEMALHRMRSTNEKNKQASEESIDLAPLVIQLAGSNDAGASPEDDIDLLILDAVQGTDPSNDRFVYQTLLESDHFSVLNVRDQKDPAAAARWEVVKGALFDSPQDQVKLDETKLIASTEGSLSNRKGVREKSATATDVVFVLHGIRDLGFWTSKLARTIQLEVLNEEAKGSKDCGKAAELDQKWHFRSLGTAYGYFGALQFLLPWDRQAKVEWFMDTYVNAAAEFPDAQFHFVGHSNGTFVCARALQQYDFCRFNKVVFAGSVVNTNYPWRARAQAFQVGSVLNYVATADWVVALFPKLFQVMFPCLDLGMGSASVDGFMTSEPQEVHQYKYIRGGHGAAIQDLNWAPIARFVVLGEPPPKVEGNTPFEESREDHKGDAKEAGATQKVVMAGPSEWDAMEAGPSKEDGKGGTPMEDAKEDRLYEKKQPLWFKLTVGNVFGMLLVWALILMVLVAVFGVLVWLTTWKPDQTWLWVSLIWILAISIFQMATDG